jgi:hypothetical protein
MLQDERMAAMRKLHRSVQWNGQRPVWAGSNIRAQCHRGPFCPHTDVVVYHTLHNAPMTASAVCATAFQIGVNGSSGEGIPMRAIVQDFHTD